MSIVVRLDVLMAKNKMRLQTLSEKTGLSETNLSILKNEKARAIRFSTLELLCKVLGCQPGDLLEYKDDEKA